jgi:hypothetical protein
MDQSDPQTLLVQVTLPIDSTSIYRVIPVGPTGIQGSLFTNVIVNPIRFKQTKHVTCTTKLTDEGIQFEIKNIPNNVVALELLALNVSIHEKQFRNVGKLYFGFGGHEPASIFVVVGNRDNVRNVVSG